MDINKLVEVLKATLQPDQREQAEQQLNEASPKSCTFSIWLPPRFANCSLYKIINTVLSVYSMLCMLCTQRGTGTEYSSKLPWIGVALTDLFVINRPVSPGESSHATALRRHALAGTGKEFRV